jgi:hypothetical protein
VYGGTAAIRNTPPESSGSNNQDEEIRSFFGSTKKGKVVNEALIVANLTHTSLLILMNGD